MPYCPKCGVEIDYEVKSCPLCDYPMPKINPEKNIDNEKKFPSPNNMYPLKVREFKHLIFSIIKTVCICSIFITVLENLYISHKITWAKYSTVCILAGLFYFYLILKLQWKFKSFIIGSGINTFILLVLLDIFNGNISWSITLGLPFILMAMLFSALVYSLIKDSEKKGFNVAAYVVIFLTLYCMGVNGFISLALTRTFALSWSIIVALISLPVALAFLYIHYKMPEQYKIKIKKKFHI